MPLGHTPRFLILSGLPREHASGRVMACSAR